MNLKASNFQVSTHFVVGFRNWYSWHYHNFLLHLIIVTYEQISETKEQVWRAVILRKVIRVTSNTFNTWKIFAHIFI